MKKDHNPARATKRMLAKMVKLEVLYEKQEKKHQHIAMARTLKQAASLQKRINKMTEGVSPL